MPKAVRAAVQSGPYAADQALSADRRCANYVIFTEAPPRHVTALTAQGGVLGCSEERVSYVTKALPWGAYPLGMTGTDGEICMWTRGRGDVSFV